MDRFDVVIVGGAAVGSAAAYFLARHRGFGGSVLVLEQDLRFERCATTRSAASIRHQFTTPENIAMSQFGTAFLRRAGDELAVDGEAPELGFREAGYLFLATPEGADTLREAHRLQRGMGVDAVLLEPAALARRFGWLRCDDLGLGSLGLAGEGWLDAWGLLQGLKRKASALGVRYREARVAGLERDGARVRALRLADGERIGCGSVINAAGAGAAALAASAGIALPVEARKRCVFHVTSPVDGRGWPLVVDASGAWFRPEGSGFLCGIAPRPDADPPSDDFDVDHALFDEVLWPLLAARVPAFEAARVRHAWAGHYDVHPLDHNMILGAHPAIGNLLFANGFSGHGLQHAPAVGRALAELVVDGGFRTLDLSRLGWQRVLDGTPLAELHVV